jgi:hypothetical protein
MELVRIIRDSRREYLQLRSLLLAPLQPTRTRAQSLASLDPQKRDKTRQNETKSGFSNHNPVAHQRLTTTRIDNVSFRTRGSRTQLCNPRAAGGASV